MHNKCENIHSSCMKKLLVKVIKQDSVILVP